MHRLKVMVSHLDWRARPRVGYRFHVVQISSLALYLGLPLQVIAWSLNHRSVAEPLFHQVFSSPWIWLPAGMLLVVRPLVAKNRDAVHRHLYGNAGRALLASLFSTLVWIGVLVLILLSLRQLPPHPNTVLVAISRSALNFTPPPAGLSRSVRPRPEADTLPLITVPYRCTADHCCMRP